MESTMDNVTENTMENTDDVVENAVDNATESSDDVTEDAVEMAQVESNVASFPVMALVGKAKAMHRCSIGACQKRTTIRIGHPNRRPTWFFVCEDHLRQIYLDLAAYYGEPPTAKKADEDIAGGVKTDEADTGNRDTDEADTGSVDTGEPVQSASEILTGAEVATTDVEIGILESASPVTDQEYYICKECGEKFKKPEQLTEYRAHTITAHRQKKGE